MSRRRAGLVVSAVVPALLAGLVPPAGAQTSADDALPPAGRTAVAALEASPQAGPLGSALLPPALGLSLIPGFADAVTGSADLAPAPVSAAIGAAVSAGIGYRTHIEPTSAVTEPVVLDRRPLDHPAAHGPAEIWRVASPSMQRIIEVEVYLPTGDAPTPVLYLLDGADSNEPSDFLNYDAGPAQARAAGMTLVVPTGAAGSQFTDWDADDPVLGHNRWETFVTRELPPLVESDARVRFNGRRAIAGISMGAGGAVRLAARNPGLYRAVAGISGCYSTLDDAGYDSTRVVVESHGGTSANMWGPRGSQRWQENDVLTRPGSLADTRVFLAAATGAIGPVEAQRFGAQPQVLVVGHTLEVQSRRCTERTVDALRGAGVPVTTWLPDAGIHNWTTFTPAITAAVADMAPVLR